MEIAIFNNTYALFYSRRGSTGQSSTGIGGGSYGLPPLAAGAGDIGSSSFFCGLGGIIVISCTLVVNSVDPGSFK